MIWTPEEWQCTESVLRGLPRGTQTAEACIHVSAALGRPITTTALKKKCIREGTAFSLLCGFDAARVAPSVRDTIAPPPPSSGSTTMVETMGGLPRLCDPLPDIRDTPPLPTESNPISTTLVVPDAHVPYHDARAFETMLNAAVVLRPDVLVIIGDFADCYAISRFVKTPERRQRLAWELDQVNKALDAVQSLSIHTHYLEGNHENRFDRYIADRAPELDGMLSMPERLRIAERGWQWHEYGGRGIKLGHMVYKHDVGLCGKYALPNSLTAQGGNLCFGHTHRAGTWYDGRVGGKKHVCLNVGWLGDHDMVDYGNRDKFRKEWQHGFGLVRQDDDGMVFAQFIPVLDGRCIVDGRVIRS